MDSAINIGFGTFLLVGAFFGWKAGSKPSLIMGIASSLFVFVGTFLSNFTFLSVIGSVLSVTFAIRLMKTKKFMPAGMLLIASLAYLLFCLKHVI